MYKKDFSRLLKLSEAGVSDTVIIQTIMELCSSYSEDPGLLTATLYITKFMEQKKHPGAAITKACTLLTELLTTLNIYIDAATPQHISLTQAVEHFLAIWQPKLENKG